MKREISVTGIEPPANIAKRFVKDSGGHTVFYPYGASWAGYLIADPVREATLRDVDRRRAEIERRLQRFQALLYPPLSIVTYALLHQRPLLVLLVFFALVGSPWAWQLWWTWGALRGLPRVRNDRNPFWWCLASLALASLLAWIFYRVHMSILASQPIHDAVATFYPDISQWLVSALLFAFVAISSVALRQRAVDRFGRMPSMLITVFAAIFAVADIGVAGSYLFHPTPRILVTEAALYCDSRLDWREISQMRIAGRLNGQEILHISTTYGGTQSCEITGLTADYGSVYETIRTTWKAAIEQPFPEESAHIPLGASREEVQALVGPPHMKIDLPQQAFYYVWPHQNDRTQQQETGAPDVVVAYFDDGRVSHVIRYGQREGKFFDYATGKVVGDPLERTHLGFVFSRARRAAADPPHVR